MDLDGPLLVAQTELLVVCIDTVEIVAPYCVSNLCIDVHLYSWSVDCTVQHLC